MDKMKVIAGIILPFLFELISFHSAGSECIGKRHSTVQESDCNELSYAFLINEIGPVTHNELIICSPDSAIQFLITFSQGNPLYKVKYKGKVVIKESELSLQFAGSGEFGRNLEVKDPTQKRVDEYYSLTVGKTNPAHDFCNEMTMLLAEKRAPYRAVSLVVCAYNEEVAFQYVFPEQKVW